MTRRNGADDKASRRHKRAAKKRGDNAKHCACSMCRLARRKDDRYWDAKRGGSCDASGEHDARAGDPLDVLDQPADLITRELRRALRERLAAAVEHGPTLDEMKQAIADTLADLAPEPWVEVSTADDPARAGINIAMTLPAYLPPTTARLTFRR